MAYEFRGATQSNTGAAVGRSRRPAPKSRAPRERRSPAGGERGGGRSLMQIFSAVVGSVFLLVGVAGFIPGLTSNYDQLTLFGTDSNAELLGLFRVSVIHNIVHLLFGVGLLAATSYRAARLFLIGGGVVYLAVAAFGFAIDEASDANFLPVNDADNLLHVALGLGMILLGLIAEAVSKRAAR